MALYGYNPELKFDIEDAATKEGEILATHD
jgi:hypothetical protein